MVEPTSSLEAQFALKLVMMVMMMRAMMMSVMMMIVAMLVTLVMMVIYTHLLGRPDDVVEVVPAGHLSTLQAN